MKRRPTHYAEILSQQNRVINTSTTPLKSYSKYKTNPYKWEEKIFSRLPGAKFKVITNINRWLNKIYLKEFIKKLPQKPILWSFFSGNYDIISELPNKLIVLEICDDTPEFFSNDLLLYKKVKRNENSMTECSDVVFTISEYLKNKKIRFRPDIHLVRNGVVFNDFAKTPQLGLRQEDELFLMRQPVIGYTGAVSHWFDMPLVEGVARELPHVNFVYIGRISPEQRSMTERLNRMPNIHFLGEKEYRELPHYLKYFKIAHIPFIMNDLVASVNPIKMYEYLAAGKRVISTPLPELLHYRTDGIIETANGIDSYKRGIIKMLGCNELDYVKKCQDIAKQNTWEERVENACKIIEQKMKDK